MSTQNDKNLEEREEEIHQQLAAAICEIEHRVGFRSNMELSVSLHPDEAVFIHLTNPDAKKEALGSPFWEDEIDWSYFQPAKGDPLQQALAWVRSVCEQEVLRQKRQAELEDVIEHFLTVGEEPPPGGLRRRKSRNRFDYLIDEDEDEETSPRKKKKPQQGPPPPDMSLRNCFEASVCFYLPSKLWVRLTDRFNKEVAKPRCFELPESGSLAEVFAWIRAMDEQHGEREDSEEQLTDDA